MIRPVLDSILDWVTDLMSTWGYLLIFAGMFLESMFLTGWLAPGTVILLLGGLFASKGDLNVFLVGGIALAAALLGDTVGYIIGRRGGQALVDKYSSHFKIAERTEKAERYFERFGPVTVLFGRLLSGLDAFVPLTAGMAGMPYWKYILYDIPSAILFTGGLTAVGYFFGEHWETIDSVIGKIGWGITGLIAAVVVAYLIYHRLKKRRQDAGAT